MNMISTSVSTVMFIFFLSLIFRSFWISIVASNASARVHVSAPSTDITTHLDFMPP